MHDKTSLVSFLGKVFFAWGSPRWHIPTLFCCLFLSVSRLSHHPCMYAVKLTMCLFSLYLSAHRTPSAPPGKRRRVRKLCIPDASLSSSSSASSASSSSSSSAAASPSASPSLPTRSSSCSDSPLHQLLNSLHVCVIADIDDGTQQWPVVLSADCIRSVFSSHPSFPPSSSSSSSSDKIDKLDRWLRNALGLSSLSSDPASISSASSSAVHQNIRNSNSLPSPTHPLLAFCTAQRAIAAARIRALFSPVLESATTADLL